MRDIWTILRIPGHNADKIKSSGYNSSRRLHSPHPIRDAETMYAEMSPSRFKALAKIMGGVIRPASMARACCNPVVIARNRGSSVSSA